MHVAVTGSTGLIGSKLVTHLTDAGHSVVRIVRSAPGRDEIGWDPDAGRLDSVALHGVDVVVHLAGAGIGDHRWTDEYKRVLRESRTKGTTLLAGAMAALSRGPRVLLSGSAIGYYGDRGDERLDETSGAGSGFLSEVCQEWEASTAAAETAGIRVAHLRTGIVLTTEGGALKKMLPLFKFGLGGRFGSGRQWQSWISIDDHVAAVTHLLEHDVRGPVNLTAPNPVTNAEFTKTLGSVVHRPSILPVPKFAPSLLLGGELAENLLYTGQRVHPDVLVGDGFVFAHPTLDGALHAVLAR